tara:strand:+ start:103 stop:717 length:615 start_codon:yes stop_codon:yes gene_type:complete
MAKRKITVSTDNSDWQAPKKRKPRKPMSDEQKAAASERLAKAREKRKEKNPDYGQSTLPPNLKDLPEEHPRHPKKVKEWIKTQKDLASLARSSVRQKIKGAIAQLSIHEGYIKNMQRYLRDGDWIDDFYGDHQQHKIRHRCVALAYYDDGTPKRSIGIYYPDMGCSYTQEMFEEEMGYERETSKSRKRDPRPVARDRRKKSKAS